MSDDDYKHGYSHGFDDGWTAAKRAVEKAMKDVVNKLPRNPYKSSDNCSVCGIKSGAEPLGIRCQHPDCPK